jgi:hypothetical protein
MPAADQTSKLRFGPYVTPVVAVGVVVECEVRGMVKIVGLSKGPIRWPIGERDERAELVVFKALARAIRQETPEAVAASWGVTLASAEEWKSVCHQPRQRKKQTHKNPPIAWKPADDAIICNATLAEAARLTGQTLTAVRKRRRILGLPDGRLAAQKAARAGSLDERAELASRILRSRTELVREAVAELAATFAKAQAAQAFWHSRQCPGAAFHEREPLSG